MTRYIPSAVFMITLAALSLAHAEDRSFTVKDDIEMTRFSEPYSIPGTANSDIAARSPDGNHFAVVVTRGLLKSNALQSRVIIFTLHPSKASQVSGDTAPLFTHRVVATIEAKARHATDYLYPTVIEDIKWSSDSSFVYFLGEGEDGGALLYRAAIDGSGARALTATGYNITSYALARRTIVYRAVKVAARGPTCDAVRREDSRAVTGEPLISILFPRELTDFLPQDSTLWTLSKQSSGHAAIKIPGSAIHERLEASPNYAPFAVSPNGRYLVELVPVSTIPESWVSYVPGPGHPERRLQRDDSRLPRAYNAGRPERYALFDLVSRRRMPLIDGPAGYQLAYGQSERAVWSRDDRRVLVTNVFLSLSEPADLADMRRRRPCMVASVTLDDLAADCLLFDTGHMSASNDNVQIEDLSFGDDDDDVLLKVRAANREQVIEGFHLQDGVWKLTASHPLNAFVGDCGPLKSKACTNIALVVHQALNLAPTLWILNERTRQTWQLWDPNPQFARIKFGHASVYRWIDKSRYEWTGGLVLPVNYVPGVRYPLILQMYDFYPNQFMTDGTAPTAFAAREFASAGFVVLQIQKKPGHTLNDSELQGSLEGYRSAIEHLAHNGLIDPTRVGIVGFSWTCWYVENALIKAPTMFAAATIADGIDHSYIDYHLFDVSSPILEEQDDRIYGVKPVGKGLKRWFDMAAGFHLDRVRVPLRIEAINPASVLQEWEIYSSLKMQNDPVDLIYFPSGTHIHQNPSERMESQQGDIDWFRFWLQGYEDPDPTKHAEYSRWKNLTGGRASGCHRSSLPLTPMPATHLPGRRVPGDGGR